MLEKNSKTYFLVFVAILGALSGVLMLFEFPTPVAPPFYKVDLSLVPSLIGGFALGPLAGILICLIKTLISILLNGTNTAFVGELASFLMDATFVLSASLIYLKIHNKKGAIISLIIGTLFLTLMAFITNYFLLIPAYVKFMNLSLDTIISLGRSFNNNVNSLLTLILFCTIPFNIIKGIIISLLTFFLYKRVSKLFSL